MKIIVSQHELKMNANKLDNIDNSQLDNSLSEKKTH